MINPYLQIQSCRETGGIGGGEGASAPHHFLEQIIFFPRNIGKHKIFTCEEHIRLECIY